ncbi:MAG TPA: ferrous iron transport protein A [Kiritimatiellia bacterium]|nr:ferrous iron transport protein A [Kiritimatiellia bacterium]
MNLADAQPGQRFLVLELDPAQPAAQQLMALGLLPGSSVTVARVAPFGDPITLHTETGPISLRRSDAQAITVKPQ